MYLPSIFGFSGTKKYEADTLDVNNSTYFNGEPKHKINDNQKNNKINNNQKNDNQKDDKAYYFNGVWNRIKADNLIKVIQAQGFQYMSASLAAGLPTIHTIEFTPLKI